MSWFNRQSRLFTRCCRPGRTRLSCQADRPAGSWCFAVSRIAPVHPGRAVAMRAAGPGWSGECARQPDPRLFTPFCRPGRTRLSCQADRPGHGASQSAGSRRSSRPAPVHPGRALAMRAGGPGWSGKCVRQPDPRLFTRFCGPLLEKSLFNHRKNNFLVGIIPVNYRVLIISGGSRYFFKHIGEQLVFGNKMILVCISFAL